MKRRMGVVLAAVLMATTSCSFLSNRLFPDTQALKDAKVIYREYVESRSVNRRAGTYSVDTMLQRRINALHLADEVLLSAEEGSMAYNQAVVIKLLVSLENEPLSPAQAVTLQRIVESKSFKSEEPWFRGLVYTFVGVFSAQQNRFVVAGSFFKRVLSDKEIPLDVRAYALAHYTNAILKSPLDEEGMDKALSQLLSFVKSLNSLEDPFNGEVVLVLAQIYANLGESSLACEYATSLLSLGVPGMMQKNTAQYIVDTEC